MSFDLLPIEIQMQIFAHFTTRELTTLIAPVSNNWKILAHQPQLWINLEFESSEHSLEEVVRLLNRSTFAEKIEFCNYANFPLFFPKPLTWNENIRKIKFDTCRFTMAELRELVDKYPNVEKVTFIRSGLANGLERRLGVFYPKKVNLELAEIITQWPSLKSIKFVSCHESDNDGDQNDVILAFATRCIQLEKFSMIYVKGVTRRSFEPLINLHGQHLRNLAFPSYDLHREDFELLLANCKNLVKLKLDGTPFLRDDGLIQLAELPNIKQLTILDPEKLLSPGYEDIFIRACFSHLESLCLGNDTYISRDVINISFPHLRMVNGLPLERYFETLDL